MFGQLGFFHRFAGKEYEDKHPLNRLPQRAGSTGALRRQAGGRTRPDHSALSYRLQH